MISLLTLKFSYKIIETFCVKKGMLLIEQQVPLTTRATMV